MKRMRVALAIIGIGAFGITAASASAAGRTVPLGTAGNFAVLAATAVTNTGATMITGNVGVSPGATVTGLSAGMVTEATDLDDPAATQGQADLATAYTAADNAKNLPCTSTIAGNLAGLTLTPGVYCAGAAIGITGTLTLNFQGDPNAFFLFRINGALTTAAAAAVEVINTGAGDETCAPNTFWALNGAAGFGAATHFTGTILANGGVSSGAGTTTSGRLLSNEAVTMNSNTVSVCPNPIPPAAELSVGASDSPDPVAPGSYVLYPITATNAGPDGASDTSITATLPAGLDFGAISAPAGWSCTAPPVGDSGAVTCTDAAFAVGSAELALTARADPTISTDTTLPVPITIASTTGDPYNTDLSTTVDTHVALPIVLTWADLSVGASGSPDPVAPGSYVLYPITATNAGPDGASDTSITATLPAGLDFGAISAPAGWSCTAPPVGDSGAVTCTDATFAAGAADFGLVAEADPAITTNTTISLPIWMSSSTDDPDPDDADLSTDVTTHIVVPVVTPPANAPTTVASPANAPDTATPLANAPATATSPVATPVTTPVPPTTRRVIPGCISSGRVTVHLSKREGSQRGTRITKAILLNARGRKLKTLKSTSSSVQVDLRGLSGQRVTLRVTTKPRSAKKTTSFTRSYQICS